MPERFFVDRAALAEGRVAIGAALARHIAGSLRMRAGDTLVVVDEDRREHGVRLDGVGSDRVDGSILWTRPATGEPRLRVSVLQALPRERMEDCVDVLVEVGVADIRPVVTERVVTRPPEDRVAGRVRRWQAVATESAQLAGRGAVPQVHPPARLADALSALETGTRVVVCAFDGGRPLATLDVDAGRPMALCIGPEGGFGDGDLEALRDAGAEAVHLGARVLRTRYAGAVACALLLARSGDLADPMSPAPSP